MDKVNQLLHVHEILDEDTDNKEDDLDEDTDSEESINSDASLPDDDDEDTDSEESINSDASLPDDDEEDTTNYAFKISLLNHLLPIKFIRNQGDQYDISGVLDIGINKLRLSSVSGNKNKLLTLDIHNPLIIYTEVERAIKFGMMFPDEFVPYGNEVQINRTHGSTSLNSTDKEGEKISYSFESTKASGYTTYLDWDGGGTEMYSINRCIDVNELIQFSNTIIATGNDVDDIMLHIVTSPSTEMLFLSAYYNNNILMATHMGKYGKYKKLYSGDPIEVKLPFSDIYELIMDSTSLLKDKTITVFLMKNMPFIIKHKLNNSCLSIAIIQEN